MKQALSIFFCLIFWSLDAQPVSIFNLMQQESIVDLFVQLDWKQLSKEKKEKQYLPAHIKFRSSPYDSIDLEAKVRTRGNMRLNICTYVPLKLKFDKSELVSDGFRPHNEIDLVRPCHKGDYYEQLILREYLAYKLYQEISAYSYKVQLVRIHYTNPDGSSANESSIGYVVENSEELVDRLSCKRNKIATMSRHAIDRKELLRVCLFEFMIGNTDWFITNRHNLEFIACPGFSLMVPVPFDFDYSGLVSAPYAAHHESIKLPAVTLRYYQGKCESKEDVMALISEFLSKKETLLNICRSIRGLDDRSVKHVTDYITDFYSIIENPKKIEQQILNHCDKWPANN